MFYHNPTIETVLYNILICSFIGGLFCGGVKCIDGIIGKYMSLLSIENINNDNIVVEYSYYDFFTDAKYGFRFGFIFLVLFQTIVPLLIAVLLTFAMFIIINNPFS